MDLTAKGAVLQQEWPAFWDTGDKGATLRATWGHFVGGAGSPGLPWPCLGSRVGSVAFLGWFHEPLPWDTYDE